MNSRLSLAFIVFVGLIFWNPISLQAGPLSAAALVEKSKTVDDVTAIKMLRGVLKRSPRHVGANYRLGFLYQKMNRRGPAETHYRAVLKSRGCHVQALNNLGGVLLDSGKTREAETFYVRALRCDASFSPAHYNLANILKDRGDFPAAVRHYGQALRGNPDHARSHHNLGIVYYHLAARGGDRGSRNGALSLRHLKRSIELEPRDALARFNYARILAAAGKRAAALKEMRMAERHARKQPALSRKIREAYQQLKYAPAR